MMIWRQTGGTTLCRFIKIMQLKENEHENSIINRWQ